MSQLFTDDELFGKPSSGGKLFTDEELFGAGDAKKKRESVPSATPLSVGQDAISGALQIGPTFVKGVADIGRLATGDRIGKDTSEAMETGIKSIQDVVGSERGAAQRKNFQSDMADENVNFVDAIRNNKGALADQVLPTLGSMILPVGVAGAAGKVASLGKAVQNMDKATIAARVLSAQKVAGIGTVAAQNASDTFAELVDRGVPIADAYLGAGITVPFSVVAGKLTGGGAEQAITSALTRSAATKLGMKSLAKASGQEGAQEMGEELGQIAGEAAATNEVPTANSVSKRMAVAGTLGAVIGGGANASTQARDAFGKQQDVPPEAQPATVTPDALEQRQEPPFIDSDPTRDPFERLAEIELLSEQRPLTPNEAAEADSLWARIDSGEFNGDQGEQADATQVDATSNQGSGDVGIGSQGNPQPVPEVGQGGSGNAAASASDTGAVAPVGTSGSWNGAVTLPPVRRLPSSTPVVGNQSVNSIPSSAIVQRHEAATDPSEKAALVEEMQRRGMVVPGGATPVGASSQAALAGEKITEEWTAFSDESGSLGVPRADMPQIKAEHRGAMIQFMKARGVQHQSEEVAADSLKPTQAEFSPAKVKKAIGFDGGDRSILISSDNYVLDGHHQWIAKRELGKPINVIRFDAPIADLIKLSHEFPSSQTASGATKSTEVAPVQSVQQQPAKGAENAQTQTEVLTQSGAATSSNTKAPATQQSIVKQDRSGLAARDDLVGAIMRVTGNNGISAGMAQTITGDNAGSGNTKLRGLFTNAGTMDLGNVAELLRVQENFDVRDGDHLSELIRNAAAGNVATSMARTENDAAANEDAKRKDYYLKRADELGLKKVGGKRKLEQVIADVDAKEAEIALEEKRLSELEANAERQAIQAADILEDGELSEAEFMRLLSQTVDYTEEEINAAVIRSQERADRRAEEIASLAAEEQAQGDSGERDGNSASAAKGGATEIGRDPPSQVKSEASPEESSQGVRPEGLELTGQTNAQAAAEFKRKQEEATKKDEATASPAVKGDQVDLFNTQDALFNSNRDTLLSRNSGSQTANQSIDQQQAELRIQSLLGDKLGKALIDSGVVTFTNKGKEYQGATFADGSIALNLDSLTAENFDGVLQHEGFHSTIKQLVGEETYQQIIGKLGVMRKLGNGADWFKIALSAVPEGTVEADINEEIGAYAIEQYVNGEKQPNVIRNWVKSLLSALRAAIIQRMPAGKLKNWAIANITGQDMARLAVAGLRAKAAGRLEQQRGLSGVMASKAGGLSQLFSKSANDGIRYSKANDILDAAKAKVDELTSPDAINTLIYNFQNKYIDLKNIKDRIIKMGGQITDLNDAYLGEETYHSKVMKRGKDFLEGEMKPLLQLLHNNQIKKEDFEQFLHARHAPERNAEMAKRNPNQAMIDAGKTQADADVKALELQLQTATAQGLATKSIDSALTKARAEKTKWHGAQAFQGTEEERNSLSGMSDAAAAQVMSSIPAGRRSTMNSAAAKVDAINAKTLDTQLAAGLIDKATFDAIKKAYQYYVPLHRDEAHPDQSAHSIGQGFSVKGAGIQRATGSNEKVTNILGHIAMQREAQNTRAEKNSVVKRLVLMAMQNPLKDFWTIDKPPMIKTIDQRTGFVRSSVDPMYKNKPNVVMARIAGKDIAIVFNERNPEAVRLAEALKNLDGQDLDVVERSIGRVTRWIASVNTQYNPIFGLINFARDVQGAMFNLTTTELKDHKAATWKETFRLFKEISKSGFQLDRMNAADQALWEDFQNNGGATGYRDMLANPEDRTKALDKELKSLDGGPVAKKFMAAAKWLSDYNESMENVVRLAAYKVSLQNGMSKERAASLAKNLTVNFNRKGAKAQKLGAFYAFFNASIQGSTRLAQTLKGPAGRKIIAGGIALGVMQQMLGMMMMVGGDDDEWEKVPDFIKERSIVIPTGKDTFISIPMPLGFNVIPNIGRLFAEWATGGSDKPTGKQLAKLVGVIVGGFNPVGGTDLVDAITPTAADPIIALLRNKDWTGKPIYREDMASLDPTPGFTRTKDSATPWAKKIAYAVNWASGGTDFQPGTLSWTPDQIDYVIGTVTGGAGRELGKLAQTLAAPFSAEELPTHKIPLVGRVVGSTAGVSGQSAKFYENIRTLNGFEQEIQGRNKKGEDVDEFLKSEPRAELVGLANAAERQVKQLRKTQKLLKDEGDNAGAKELDASITEVMKGLNMEMRQASRRSKSGGH